MDTKRVDVNTNTENEKTQEKNGSNQAKTPLRMFSLIVSGITTILQLLILTVIFLLLFSLYRRSKDVKFSEGLFSQGHNQQNTKFIENKAANSTHWIEKCSHSEKVCSKIAYYFNAGWQEKVNEYLRSPASNYLNKNLIFHGEPGTGKSYCALQIAKNISSSYTIVPAGTLQKLFVGSGATAWSKIVDEAKKQAESTEGPVVIIVEEMDSLVGRKEGEYSGVDNTLVNTFLESIDSLRNSNLEIVIIGTTNTIDHAEPAAIRIGRFNSICFEYPDKDGINKIIEAIKNKIENDYLTEEVSPKPGEKLSESKTCIYITDHYWSQLKKEIPLQLSACGKETARSTYPVTFIQVLSSVEKIIREEIFHCKFPAHPIILNAVEGDRTVKHILELVGPLSTPNPPKPFKLAGEENSYYEKPSGFDWKGESPGLPNEIISFCLEIVRNNLGFFKKEELQLLLVETVGTLSTNVTQEQEKKESQEKNDAGPQSYKINKTFLNQISSSSSGSSLASPSNTVGDGGNNAKHDSVGE